ncbi:MAG: metal-dependent transcriptional regulator [Propionibacteriaceae bacterium]|nr:metal-dependent transcriptional regulator [Propionibacteriaceae bacterium]
MSQPTPPAHNPRSIQLDDLSPVVQDYLKAIWTATEWGAAPITTTGLAQRFNTSKATVSEAMRRLSHAGLINYRPYHPVTLTATGATHATAMVRRHRLIETFLAKVLNYPWTQVHTEAERLEHAVSDTFIDRIDAYLEHPKHDPHGDPIPPMPTITNATQLSATTTGEHHILRVSDANPTTLNTLATLGLTPGTQLKIIRHTTKTIKLQNSTGTHVVSTELAAAIWLLN